MDVNQHSGKTWIVCFSFNTMGDFESVLIDKGGHHSSRDSSCLALPSFHEIAMPPLSSNKLAAFDSPSRYICPSEGIQSNEMIFEDPAQIQYFKLVI